MKYIVDTDSRVQVWQDFVHRSETITEVSLEESPCVIFGFRPDNPLTLFEIIAILIVPLWITLIF